MSWLDHMVQYREKTSKGLKPSLGLYSYPVLMAADILLYEANKVPVGEDQKQHLELAQKIARSFNNEYTEKVFVVPEMLPGILFFLKQEIFFLN
jgi:tryptophanyl-tRNA synthetase